MCANYEVQLQTLQTEQDTLREQLAAAKELYEKYGKELSEERHYRKELEGKFAALNEECESKIQQCLGNVNSFEERIGLLGRKQESDLAICVEDLELAKSRQKELHSQLEALNERYQKLLRTNTQSAEEMREQQIELPQTVEELQFLALQLREDLIGERAAREHETRELRDELTVAREQLLEMEIRDKENEELLMRAQQQRRSGHRRERGASASVSVSNYECQSPSSAQQQQSSTGGGGGAASAQEAGNQQQQQQQLADCCPNHRRLVNELESRLAYSMHKSARLEERLADSNRRCAQMQNELDTSETVQRDFVRLSQQLQIELEKIRQAEIEVRWQEPEDVSHCNGCNKKFAGGGNEARSNCKHCGKIFCSACLAHKVPGGPSKRPVTVCNLCHSLLTKENSLVGELKPEEAE